MPKRLTKTALTEHLQARVDYIQKAWGFDPANGTFQIPFIAADRARTNPLEAYMYKDSGMSVEQAHLAAANRDYGELGTLAAIADEFDLALSQTNGLRPQRLVGRGYTCLRYRPE